MPENAKSAEDIVRAREDDLAALATEICPDSPIDLGIVRAVKMLRDAGVYTFEACEGGDGHAYRDPTVRFHGTPAEGWRVLALCKEARLPVRDLMRTWDVEEGEPRGPYWAVTFSRKLLGSNDVV